MTVICKQHREDLYNKLYDAYELCSKNNDDTYLHMIGQVLDHMNRNKQFLNLK